MAVAAIIQLSQPGGGGTPAAGLALIGSLSLPVTVTNGVPGGARFTFELVDSPAGSAVTPGVKQSGPLPSFAFTPDVRGGYLLHLTVQDSAGNTAEDYRVFQVAETSGRIIPPKGADSSSLNFGGQTDGWKPYMDAYLRAVDAGGTGGAFYQRTASSGITAGHALYFSGTNTNHATTSTTRDPQAAHGVALSSVSSGATFFTQTQGPLDPAVATLGAGPACAVGFTSTGALCRVTSGSNVSGLHRVGFCDAVGDVYVLPHRANHYDVVDFGAQGDGVTDDTAAVSAAITAANSAGGATVFFPTGSYIITDNLTHMTGTGLKLRGNGYGNSALLYEAPLATQYLVDGPKMFCAQGEISDLSIINETNLPFVALDDPTNHANNAWLPSHDYSASPVGTLKRAEIATFRLLRLTTPGVTGAHPPFGQLMSGSDNAYSSDPSSGFGAFPIVKLSSNVGSPTIATYDHIFVSVGTSGKLGTAQWDYSLDDGRTTSAAFNTYAGVTKYPVGNSTTVASASNGADPSTMTSLTVAAPPSTPVTSGGGTLIVLDNGGNPHVINYTSYSANVFSGCTSAFGGAGTLATGGLVVYSDTGLYLNFVDAKTTTTGTVTLGTGPFTIPVASTANFTVGAHGQINVGGQIVTYTGVTGGGSPSFTGCSGGSGTFAGGTAVNQVIPGATWGSPVQGTGFSHVIGDSIQDNTAVWSVVNGPVGVQVGDPGGAGDGRVVRCLVKGWCIGVLMNEAETCDASDLVMGNVVNIWMADGNRFYNGPTDPIATPGTANANSAHNINCAGTYGAGIIMGALSSSASRLTFTAYHGTAVWVGGGTIGCDVTGVYVEGSDTCVYAGHSDYTGCTSTGGENVRISAVHGTNFGDHPWCNVLSTVSFSIQELTLEHFDLLFGNPAGTSPAFQGLGSSGILGVHWGPHTFPGRTGPIFDQDPVHIISRFSSSQPHYADLVGIVPVQVPRPSIGLGCVPQAALDVRGNIATRHVALTGFTSGTYNNARDDENTGFNFGTVYELVGLTGNVTITGLAYGSIANTPDGQWVLLKIFGNSVHTVTFSHQDAGSLGGYRFICESGSSLTVTPPTNGYSTVELRYSPFEQRWLVR